MAGDVICLDGGLFPEPKRQPGGDTSRGRGFGAEVKRRLKDRQAAAITHGQHPLSAALRRTIQLHPDVRAAAMAGDDGAGPTCGGCALRRQVSGGNKSFPKCAAHPIPRSRVDEHGKTWEWEDYPRATHGSGTDVQAGWPACTDYQPKERDRQETR